MWRLAPSSDHPAQAVDCRAYPEGSATLSEEGALATKAHTDSEALVTSDIELTEGKALLGCGGCGWLHTYWRGPTLIPLFTTPTAAAPTAGLCSTAVEVSLATEIPTAMVPAPPTMVAVWYVQGRGPGPEAGRGERPQPGAALYVHRRHRGMCKKLAVGSLRRRKDWQVKSASRAALGCFRERTLRLSYVRDHDLAGTHLGAS
jgi:hypothetical protein